MTDNNTIKKPSPVFDEKLFIDGTQSPAVTDNPLDSLAIASRINILDEYDLPPVAVSIVNNGESYILGTLGDFSLITGKAKSKKTFTTSMILTACLVDIFQDTIKSHLPPDKHRIILFDTEQSKYYVWRVLNRIARLCNVEVPGNIEVYSLRECDTVTRRNLIEHILITTNTENNIGLVVIDGIRDCINDINDPSDATLIATKLLQWTSKANCHIVTVLHENKNDSNARGHVGSELTNKAGAVISVTRDKNDKNVSIVSAIDCRDKDFPPFAFTVCESGLPEILPDYEMSGTAEKRKTFNVYDIEPATHHKILKEVFKESKPLKRPELTSMLKVEWMAWGQKIGDNAMRDVIVYYTKMKWIDNPSPVGKAGTYQYLC